MLKKKTPFLLSLGLSVLLFCSGTIYGMTSIGITNQFSTGVTNIHLAEYQKNGDVESTWTDALSVLPGENISKIPRIINDGNDCYVRAKISYLDAEGNTSTIINDDNLYGISEKWLKADDGYYYYKEKLPSEQSVDLFKGVKIPFDLPKENEEISFYLKVDVDAIQERNFEPDFTSSTPWGNITIEKFTKTDEYDVREFTKSEVKNFQIEYQGSSSELIINSENFFENLPYLLPGDTYTDTIKLNNTSSRNIRLYFRSEATDNNDLLDKIELKITSNIDGTEKEVYNGSLRDAPSEDLLLGKVRRKEEADDTLTFTIYVPDMLKNEYTLENSEVKWIFSAQKIYIPILEDPENPEDPVTPVEPVDPTDPTNPTNPTNPGGNHGDNSGHGSNTSHNGDKSRVNGPQTGDTMNMELYIALMGSSLILGVISIYKLRKKEDEENV